MAEGGPAYIAAVKQSGREPHPDDLPPELGWEGEIWWLWERVRTQWREGMNGRTGLDYNPAISIIRARRWDLPLALELLQVIETIMLQARPKGE